MATITPDSIPFLQPGQSWPPEGDLGADRIERYKNNKRLFRGEHAAVYKDWVRLLREDQKATLELVVNFPGAVSKLFSDLLFGELPKFSAGDDDSEEQQWLDDFVRVNRLHRSNYKAALAQSYRGEAIYKLRLVEGRERAVAEVIPASIWFPVVDPDNVTDVLAHVIAWTKTVDRQTLTGTKTDKYLRAEIHLPGSVHQRLWLLKEDRIAERVELSTLYDEPPPDDMDTNVDEPLVVHVPNLEVDDSPFGVDDYSEADTLFQELDVRIAQIARVLDKHTDPNMYGPESNLVQDPATGEWKAKVGGNYFAVPDGEQPPGYLVWDAQLTANFDYLDRILQGLYIATDTNSAAFSMVEDGNFPSGAALKRLLMRPLARTNRKRLYFDPALKDLFRLAAELERANGRQAPQDFEVEIEWRDGLPEDPREAAEVEQIRTGNKATSSVRSAIRRLDGGTQESIQAELDEIAADEAQGAAPVPTQATGFAFGETET